MCSNGYYMKVEREKIGWGTSAWIDKKIKFINEKELPIMQSCRNCGKERICELEKNYFKSFLTKKCWIPIKKTCEGCRQYKIPNTCKSSPSLNNCWHE